MAEGGGFLPPAIAFLLGDIKDFKLKMDEAAAKAAETDGKISKAGKLGSMAFLAVGAAVAGVTVESLKLASQFDATMTRINTQDNAGLTTRQMQDLKASVLDLAGQTAQAPEALSDAMVHVYGSGLKGAAALDLLKVAAEGATVGHANLTDVTNALDAAVATGIKGTGDYKQAMGELNATVGAGDMTMQNLADALGGPMLATVKGYGLSITDVGAALAVFGDRNIRGAEAATETRMAVQALAVPAKAGAGALQSIGLSMTDLRDTMQKGGLKAALNELNQHLLAAGYNSTTAGALITEAFGKKAGGGLNVLMDSLASSTSNFNDKFEMISKTGATFGQSWSETQDTLSFKMKALESSVQALGVRFGEWLTPKLNSVLGVVQRDAIPAMEHFGKSVANALNSPAAREAASVLQATWRDVVRTFKDVMTSVGNLVSALKPAAGFIAGAFIAALRAAGMVMADVIGPAIKAVTGFLKDHAGVIKLVAEVVLPALIARWLYLKALAAADMFVNFVNGIGRAADGVMAFTKAVRTGAIFDEVRFKGMLAAEAMGNLGTKVSGTAKEAQQAEQAVGASGGGGLVGKLAGSLGVIGAVVGVGAGLVTWLGNVGKKAVDATAELTGYSNMLLDIANGSSAISTQMGASIAEFQKMSRGANGVNIANQMIKPVDDALAHMVQSGNLAQAKAALAALDAQITAAGGDADAFNNQLRGYSDAVGVYALQQREAATSQDNTTTALQGGTAALGATTSAANDAAAAIAGVGTTQQDLSAGINASSALDNWQRQLDAVTKSAQDNGTALTGNSDAALANRDALRNAAQAIVETYTNQRQMGQSALDAGKNLEQQITDLENNATQAGLNKDAVKNLIDQMHLVPDEVTTAFQIQADLKPIEAAMSALDALNAKREAVGNSLLVLGTGVQAHAAGGPVSGAGTSTSDSILSWLSNKEWVISATGAQAFPEAFLQAVNRGDVAAAQAILSGPTAPAAGATSYLPGVAGGGDVAVNVYVQTPGEPGWKKTRVTRQEVLRYQGRNSKNGLSLSGVGG